MEATILIGYVTGALAMMAYCVWVPAAFIEWRRERRMDNASRRR